jgi:hypothetical protein
MAAKRKKAAPAESAVLQKRRDRALKRLQDDLEDLLLLLEEKKDTMPPNQVRDVSMGIQDALEYATDTYNKEGYRTYINGNADWDYEDDANI